MALSWYNGFSPDLREESFAWMKAEMRAGRLGPPGPCQACGEGRGHLDYHTEDYSRPFGPHIYAYQLCFRCHMMCHSRFRMKENWFFYIKQLENGAVYTPLWSRKEIGKIWISRWTENPVSQIESRGEMVFFRSLSVERGPEGTIKSDGQMSMFGEDYK